MMAPAVNNPSASNICQEKRLQKVRYNRNTPIRFLPSSRWNLSAEKSLFARLNFVRGRGGFTSRPNPAEDHVARQRIGPKKPDHTLRQRPTDRSTDHCPHRPDQNGGKGPVGERPQPTHHKIGQRRLLQRRIKSPKHPESTQRIVNTATKNRGDCSSEPDGENPIADQAPQ